MAVVDPGLKICGCNNFDHLCAIIYNSYFNKLVCTICDIYCILFTKIGGCAVRTPAVDPPLRYESMKVRFKCHHLHSSNELICA